MKQKEKNKDKLDISEAVENLSTIAGLDPDGRSPLGIVKRHKFVVQAEGFSYKTIEWLGPENAEEVLEHLRSSFGAVLEYLKDIAENQESFWEEEATRRSLQQIMELVGEAAKKLEAYASLYQVSAKRQHIADLPEYKELQAFYLDNIESQFKEKLEGDDEWEKEWRSNDENLILDIDKLGLRNFETVKRDKEYELFYLHNEDERPYFDPSMLRNIKLVCDFDEAALKNFAEDPLVRIRFILDRDAMGTARQILDSVHEEVRRFYRLQLPLQRDEMAKLINKSMMALMLAANPRNLLQNSAGKGSIGYLQDFLTFLRNALQCKIYQHHIAYQDDIADEAILVQLQLLHRLAKALYFRKGAVKEEMTGFIYRLINKGGELSGTVHGKSMHIFETLQVDDENMRYLLRYYPNGPLFKILDVVRDKAEQTGFDTLHQGNVPQKIFEIAMLGKNHVVLRLPCPTVQYCIDKAVIIDEYKAMLRALDAEKKQTHLVLNFQDLTSWKESSRCLVLQNLAKNIEFDHKLAVVTLPKNTDFYFQTESYLEVGNTKEFCEQLKKQVVEEDSCGFSLVKGLSREKISSFIDQVMPLICKTFFSNKNALPRNDRLDFIEIFYHFLILKIIELLDAHSIGFACKDALDTGAAAAASFFGFIKLVKGEKWSKEELDALKWMFYAPALMVRERTIDAQRFNRQISALSCMEVALEGKANKLTKPFTALYGPNFFESLTVNT